MATTFRQDLRTALVTMLDAFIAANSTLLRRSEAVRPASIVGDLPIGFVDGIRESARYDVQTRGRTATAELLFVSPIGDNAETVVRHDVLVDKLYDHFQSYVHLIPNTSWDRLTVADEPFPVEANGETRYLHATRFTFENVLIIEGRP